MKVAVVGATGNVGTSLLDRLSREPAVDEVRAIARRPPAATWANTTFHLADIRRDDLVPLFRGADAVVHVAWLFQPTHRPTVTWSTNVVGTERIIAAVIGARVPALVYASSVGAYTPAHGRQVDESWPTDGLPTAGYSREKAYVERLLDVAEARHPELRVVRLRPGFIFQRRAATEQRRLFGGPLVPTGLLRPELVGMLAYPKGLAFQGLHADDAATAFSLAVTQEVRGAFNLAADPVVNGPTLAEAFGVSPFAVPPSLVRALLAAAWRGRVVPAEPALFDLAMGLPIMRTDRARDVLGWTPTVPATDALHEALVAMRQGAGGGTSPLRADSLGSRLRELARGVGQRP